MKGLPHASFWTKGGYIYSSFGAVWVGGGVGCVGIEEGFMHGHISPLKESPHCQLPTIIKRPCRVYHWLCLTSLIRQICATYIGQQSSTALTFRWGYSFVCLFRLLTSMKSCLHINFFKIKSIEKLCKVNFHLLYHVMRTRAFISSRHGTSTHLCPNLLWGCNWPPLGFVSACPSYLFFFFLALTCLLVSVS